ncbi:MAG: hypothetical protein Q7R49_04845 [Candidatus Daviesbacteria bacterium]|nr:hypothetical protein [Candidatus Daviesbacteria bacterium]
MIKLKLIFAFVFTLFIILNFKPIIIRADCDELCQQAQAKQDEINQLQAKISDLQQEKKTLKSQLDIIDSQNKITELKIQQTTLQIEKLGREIDDLSDRITRISSSVDSLSEILLNRIIQTYKYGSITPIDLLFSSRGFADALQKIKYLQVAQANDKKVLYQLQATKVAYDDQKTDKETRQAQAEKLKKDLDIYQAQLIQQKLAKAALLKATQNDEAIYQSKLQKALAEQVAILGILNGAGKEIAIGHINKGDNIGNFINGKSACSSGSHLHFEVHKDGALQNPANYLSNKGLTWDNSPDGTFGFGGSWDWPISDPVYIEQGFGITYWAKMGWYSIPPGHSGIDMWSPSGSGIKAVYEGELSRGSIACGGGTLLYKRVSHSDGISTYYLHTI